MSADLIPVRRALLSVSDKTGLIEFGKALSGFGIEILSTGGTYKALKDAGVAVKEVAEHTGFPEMMDGRVKTLHPTIHGGILALRDHAEHKAAMDKHNIPPIDLVVVNLYPFAATVAKGADFPTCIENIDIGGPAMIRSAAKNHGFVNVVVDVADYAKVLDALKANKGATDLKLRRELAAKAYAHTGAYDSMIATWFARQNGESFPPTLLLSAERKQTLRYGENPHQDAAFYTITGDKRPGVASAVQVQGKELSYNNLNDTDAAFELVSEFSDKPTIAIIKHANPCGVATADSLSAAWDAALRCDPVSAFGGIVAMNRKLDKATAEKIGAIFTEVIVAPEADDDAKAVLAAKKNLRLLLTGGMADPVAPGWFVKSVAGGYLVQTRDAGRIVEADLKIVTQRAPTPQELADMLFAFRVGKHVKSNTIVYAKNGATVGIGAGQMSRVDSARIAFRKAQDSAKAAGLTESLTKGSVAASDAFFPFADGLEVLVEAGATAVIQPGGSIRDQEVVDAANKAGLAMVFTGMRHFRH